MTEETIETIYMAVNKVREDIESGMLPVKLFAERKLSRGKGKEVQRKGCEILSHKAVSDRQK